ncbi:MAG: response regulator [Candidatus Omnitrophica bacterium]|nr:response regulator [Candidatus Omnitrophota bacterium]
MNEILVVDDDPDVLDATQRALKTRGYRAAPVRNPEEALAIFKQNPSRFDLIILDWKLRSPIDGDMVADLIRYQFPDFKIPIIFVTAHTQIASKYLLKHGAYDTLKKPITIDELMAAIERALHKRPEEDPHQNAPAYLNSKELRRQEIMRKIIRAIVNTPSIKEAARALQCSRMTLYRWLKTTGLDQHLLKKISASPRER